jgi:hypothetical protein
MVKVFSTRNVTSMDAKTRDLIINSGVPIELYMRGVVNLGANNKKAIKRLVQIGNAISDHKLPMYPSRFIEFVVDRTTGVSKQDYRITLDGEPGYGKSYTSTYFGGRYGIEAAERNGQDPKDYFSLDNCALLQDTAGVTKLMDECDKFQCVVIDDAGIAAGNRDFLTQSNKNMSAILQVCRTKRWFLIYNMPNRRMVDVQIRDLVYSKAYIHLPCHDKGFNVVKINRERIDTGNTKGGDTWKHRLNFDAKKINYYLAFSTDFLDPYVGLIEKYDINRDAATDALIHERAGQESERKNPTNTREETWKDKMDKHYGYVCDQCANGGKVNRTAIAAHTGLADRDIVKRMGLYHTTGSKKP